jgi:flagellar basal-body rod protein FlgB
MTPASPISTLETYLKLTESRQQAITANMANIDTPGYRTRDINFEGEMQKAMNQLITTSSDGNAPVELHPAVQEVQGLMERPDGNNVNLDREGLLMSETQLQYQIGIQLVKREFHQLLSAINGGGQ